MPDAPLLGAARLPQARAIARTLSCTAMAKPGVAALVAVPLAAGALVPVQPVLDGPAVCPFRALTGVPCPLCGATRAFVLAGHGDGRWLDYGAVWVLAAAALLIVALIRRPRLRALPSVAAIAVLAWAWALGHAGTIES